MLPRWACRRFWMVYRTTASGGLMQAANKTRDSSARGRLVGQGNSICLSNAASTMLGAGNLKAFQVSLRYRPTIDQLSRLCRHPIVISGEDEHSTRHSSATRRKPLYLLARRHRHCPRRAIKVTDVIERVGGQPPKSLRQFLAEQAHLFSVGGPATIRG